MIARRLLQLNGGGTIGLLVALLAVAVAVPVFNLAFPEGSALHLPTYGVTLLGKFLCYALLALSIDLIWG